jgi:sigma-E factor negative regulatory protein RseA
MTTKQNHELLSALVDGELKGEELDHALALLASEDALSTMKRYQLASDVMQGYTMPMQVDLSSRLKDIIAEEPAYAIEQKKAAKIIAFPTRYFKQVSSLAVVASVGALAVLGVLSQPEQAFSPTVQTAAYTVGTEVKSDHASSNRWTVSEPEVEERLNTYLVDHNEYAGSSVFSYARVVSYETE